MDTRIAKSQKIGVGQSALCYQTVESHEKLSHVCFKSFRMAHEHYKSYTFVYCFNKVSVAKNLCTHFALVTLEW